MKGDPGVLDYLNKGLRHELTAINQYWLHYRLLDNWGYKALAKQWRKESIEEMQHADKLVERIITLGGNRWSLVRHVYLPSIAASVLSSLKVAVGFAFTGACVGEFVAASRGLGYLLSFAQSTYNAALMFALIILILVVVLAIFWVAGRLERRLLRWS